MIAKISQMSTWTRFLIVCAVSVTAVVALAAAEASAFDPASTESSAVNLTTGEAQEVAINLGKAYGSPLLIPAAAFRSDGVNPSQLQYDANLGMLRGQDSENAFAVAPIYLPEGATVASIMASIFDGLDGTGAGCEDPDQQDLGVWIFRVTNNTGEVSTMAFFGTTGLNAAIQHPLDSSVEYPMVEYPEYAYYAATRVCHSAHAFHNLQIWYSMD